MINSSKPSMNLIIHMNESVFRGWVIIILIIKSHDGSY